MSDLFGIVSALANVAMVLVVLAGRWWERGDDLTSKIQDLVIRLETMCRDLAHVERDIAQCRQELVQFRETTDDELGAKYYEHERRISAIEGRLNSTPGRIS